MKNLILSVFFSTGLIISGFSQTQATSLVKKEIKSISNSGLQEQSPATKERQKTGKKNSPINNVIANMKLVKHSADTAKSHRLCDHTNGNCDPRNLPLSENGKLLSVDGFEVDFTVPDNTEISSVCFTPRPYVTGGTKDAGCSYSVPCDNASNRDAAAAPTKYFQVIWHVLQTTSGGASSNIDQTRIDDLMTELNADFAPYNMIFCSDPTNFVVDDVNYNHDEDTEEVQLKMAHITTPAQLINIYVVGSMGAGGYARFPYDPMGGTSSTSSGIVMNRGNCNVGTHTLAHEMGHTFGLEHTFSGVDERSECSSCYEKIRNANGSSNTSGAPTINGGPYTDEGDREGDWCSDTNPHNTYAYNCSSDPTTTGACNGGFSWNAAVSNHMSYSFCSSQFTDQQGRRMHCMTNTYLSSWTSYGGGTCGNQPPVAEFSGTAIYGTAAHPVTFTDLSQPSSVITSWTWDFDVTAIGGVTPATFVGQVPPVVNYANAGLYTVSLTITSSNGNDTETKVDYITVISPPNTCDTLYTQWETPTPTLAIYSFGVAGSGDHVTGTPSTTFQATNTDAIEFTERFSSAGAGTTVGGVRVGLTTLYDLDGDMTFDINIWDDATGAQAGEPDWLVTPTAGGYLGGVSGINPTTIGVPNGNFYAEIWIPFPNEVAIPGSFFHVGINMNPGDVSDTLLLLSSNGGEGETDNSNFVWSSSFGTNSYENDVGLDFDLDIYPMLQEYTPSTIITDLQQTVVCDTTFIEMTDTTYYTDWTNMASIEYVFSDGQTFTFAPPTSANNTISTYFTSAGPVTFTVTAVGSVCGRSDTSAYILPYDFMATPDADFSKDLPNPICNTDVITFTAATAGYSDYTWDFGDGTTVSSGSTDNQTHTYATPGLYYVSMTATAPGFEPADTIFLEQFEGGIPGTWATFDNDGATPNGAVNPPFTGTDATAWLADDYTGSGDDEATSTSWNVPATTAADDWLISPQVLLNATSSLAWDGEALSGGFPDGYEVWVTTGAQTSAGCGAGTMVYSTGGENTFRTNHNVDLQAAGFASQNVRVCFHNNSLDMFLLAIDNVRIGTTGQGCSYTEQKLDYVEIIDCSISPPTADGSADVNSGCAPLDVTFTDVTTIGDPATSWLWNFDDGTFSTAQNPPLHTYTAIGTYNVIFQACNSGGCATETIVITVDETPVISTVAETDPTLCGGADGQIDITATVGTGSLQYSIDGGTTFQAGNVFTSLSANTYPIEVMNGSCIVTSSATLTDPAAPTFTLASSNPTSCGGADGTITISGLSASTSYNITYDDDAATIGATAMLSDALGEIVVTGLNAGTYNQITVDLGGCITIDPITITLIDPASPTFTLAATDPTNCGGTDGTIIISGLTPSTIYGVTYDDDAATVGPTSLGSNGSGVITLTGLNAGTYDQIILDLLGCNTIDPGSFVLSDPSSPTFTVGFTSPTTCTGADGTITLSGLTASTSYTITYDDDGTTVGPSGALSDGAGSILLTGLDAGTYNQIIVEITGCATNDGGSYALVDPALPTYTVTSSDPITCGASDGFITLIGLTATTSYTVTYDDDGATVGPAAIMSDVSGDIVITGLDAGTYNQIITEITGCAANDAGSYVLSDPLAPTFTIAGNDPLTCGGTGNLTLVGLTATTSYNIVYTDGISVQGPTPIISDGSGNLVIPNLGADTYTNIQVELAGCTGSDAGPYVLSDPGTPSYTVTSSNPTACGGTDGTITLTGLNTTAAYDVTYNDDATAVGPTSIISDGSGVIVITGLDAGIYDAITVDLAGCITVSPGTITLVDPAITPTFTVAVTNTTTCSGIDGILTISGLLASTSYDVSYDDGGGTTGPTSIVSDGSGNIIIAGLGADSYSNILVDLFGCNATDAGPYVISVPTSPTFSVTGSSDPTACGVSDGFIDLSGLLASTLYDITYDDGGAPQGPLGLASDALGNLSIIGLTSGTYDNITVTINGCATTDPSSIGLTDPLAPTFSFSSSNPTSCAAGDGTISISGLNTSTIYAITYTDGIGIQGPTSLASDGSGNIIITGLSADSYSAFTVDLLGCIGTDPGPIVLLDPTSPTYTVTSTDPASCGATDGTIVITGLNVSTIYDITYVDGIGTNGPTAMLSDPSGTLTITGLGADSYSALIVDLLGCTTPDAGPWTLIDPPLPTFTVTTMNPSSCGAIDGFITISGLNATTNYDVTYDDGIGTNGPTTILSDASGDIVISGLEADVYSQVIVSLLGCSTTDVGPYVLSDPSSPSFTATLVGPTTCGGSDGYVLLSGLNISTNYDITYDDGTGSIGPTSITTDVAGDLVINGLSAGTYTGFIVDLLGCITNDAGPYILADPTLPAPPVASIDSTYCEGDVLADMTATGTGGTFTWYDDSGLTNSVGTGGTLTPPNTAAGTTTYFVIETANGCAGTSSSVTIIIDETPTSSGAGIDQTICDTTDLATLGGNTPAVGTGVWIVVSGSGTFVDDTDGGTDVSGLTIGTNEYMWTISNGSCASSSANVIITMDECLATSPVDLVIPSGFTPDGDLVNDDWELVGIDQYPDCQVEIFNKWGNSIFTSTGYTTAWDGTVNGSPLPVGAFYYIIVLNDGSSDPLKGTVTIIK